VSDPDFFGSLDLNHLGFMDRNLNHAKLQRGHLLADDFQPNFRPLRRYGIVHDS